MTSRPRKNYRRYCDCGRVARYKQKVLLFRSDLETEIHFNLYLCEACFLLELDQQKSNGRWLPKATRLG